MANYEKVIPTSVDFNGERVVLYDGNYSTKIVESTSINVKIQLPKSIALNKYAITTDNVSRAPKDWKLYGSNDNSLFFEIDSRVGATDWVKGTAKEFFVDNYTSYKHYKLVCSVSYGGSLVDYSELEFFSVIPTNLILINHSLSYKKYSSSAWQAVTSTTPTESDYLQGNTLEEIASIPDSAWQQLTGTVELCYYTDTTAITEAQFNIETEPFTLADEFEGKQVKILEYTDNPSQVESVVETETEPYSIYDEFGDTLEVLYYTDDPDKSKAELEITANYSPLDEIDENFEVVTWTDEDPAERILSLTALPKPQFIKQIDFNDVYGTITEFLTTESFSGTENGVIRYLLSPDRITWKTWTGSTFANIDVSNMSNIVANGIKKSILQSLTSSDWSKWIGQKLYLGIYLEEDIRDKTKAHIDTISYSDSVPKESTQISDAKLYILNTVSTINVSFAGSTLSGSIDDEDEGKVQYRVLLNDATYFPADGSFTPLMASPLDISLTIANKDVNIDENNTLRVEFKDYWGTVDYWQRNFVGSYSGLLFTDSTGEYYTTDIGEVLQYLDFGVIIAGQTTIEHEIILKNTYGYSVSDIKLYTKEGSFPSGMRAQFGTNLISFEALDVLSIEGVLHDGEEIPFYFRLSTQLGVTPPTVGEFDIVVVANKADEIE